VVRFIVQDSIEERVKMVQESKNQVIHQILNAKNAKELSIERMQRMKLLLE
jgi:SNF2 family DNA or RNA helicase